MIVGMTGGRSYADRETVYRVLDAIHTKTPITLLVHGACHLGGADILAEDWAKSREVDYRGCPAKKRNGKTLGPERNQRMVNLVLDIQETGLSALWVRFPGERGTTDCATRADAAGITVVVVK